MKEAILNALNKDRLSEFFNGKIYPLLIAALVTLGSVTGTEVFLNVIHSLLIFTALLVSPSVKPILISLCTYVYQISVVHSPFYPNYSKYYFGAWQLPVLIISVSVVIAGVLLFVFKNKLYKEISFKKSPLLLPLLILSLAFMTNGAFSSVYNAKNLLFGGGNVLIYLVLFLVIYHGFGKEEKSGELVEYFSYISMLIAFVIGIEMLHLYISSDDIFIDGSINKVGVALGWGIWNIVGVSSAVLIPMNFYGMQNSRYPWLYFISASVAYVSAVMTMSRNALVFATLTYAACIIIFCFVGKRKKLSRILAVCGIALVLLGAVVFWDKINLLFRDFFERGFSDNGRFNLWRAAFENFLSAPIFGNGFFGFEVETAVFGPLPKMAHNTVLELLSATGIFGLFSYLYYRFESLKPFIKKPSLAKTMLGISILTFLLESLLDNFVFNFFTVFYVVIALAIAEKAYKEELID